MKFIAPVTHPKKIMGVLSSEELMTQYRYVKQTHQVTESRKRDDSQSETETNNNDSGAEEDQKSTGSIENDDLIKQFSSVNLSTTETEEDAASVKQERESDNHDVNDLNKDENNLNKDDAENTKVINKEEDEARNPSSSYESESDDSDDDSSSSSDGENNAEDSATNLNIVGNEVADDLEKLTIADKEKEDEKETEDDVIARAPMKGHDYTPLCHPYPQQSSIRSHMHHNGGTFVTANVPATQTQGSVNITVTNTAFQQMHSPESNLAAPFSPSLTDELRSAPSPFFDLGSGHYLSDEAERVLFSSLFLNDNSSQGNDSVQTPVQVEQVSNNQASQPGSNNNNNVTANISQQQQNSNVTYNFAVPAMSPRQVPTPNSVMPFSPTQSDSGSSISCPSPRMSAYRDLSPFPTDSSSNDASSYCSSPGGPIYPGSPPETQMFNLQNSSLSNLNFSEFENETDVAAQKSAAPSLSSELDLSYIMEKAILVFTSEMNQLDTAAVTVSQPTLSVNVGPSICVDHSAFSQQNSPPAPEMNQLDTAAVTVSQPTVSVNMGPSAYVDHSGFSQQNSPPAPELNLLNTAAVTVSQPTVSVNVGPSAYVDHSAFSQQNSPPAPEMNQLNTAAVTVSQPTVSVNVGPSAYVGHSAFSQQNSPPFVPVTPPINAPTQVVRTVYQRIQGLPEAPALETRTALERLELRPARQREAFARLASRNNEELSAGDEDNDTKLIIMIAQRLEMGNEYLYALVKRLQSIPGALAARNNQNQSALLLACLYMPDQPLVARFLAEALQNVGHDLNEVYDNGNTILHKLAAKGDDYLPVLVELVSMRDANGRPCFDINRHNHSEGTPLLVAVRAHGRSTNCSRTVQFLISQGADVIERERCGGMTSLHLAIKESADPLLVQILLKAAANRNQELVNCLDYQKDTPLHYAHLRNDVHIQLQLKIITLLTQYGAIHVNGSQGKMPLTLVTPERKEYIRANTQRRGRRSKTSE